MEEKNDNQEVLEELMELIGKGISTESALEIIRIADERKKRKAANSLLEKFEPALHLVIERTLGT